MNTFYKNKRPEKQYALILRNKGQNRSAANIDAPKRSYSRRETVNTVFSACISSLRSGFFDVLSFIFIQKCRVFNKKCRIFIQSQRIFNKKCHVFIQSQRIFNKKCRVFIQSQAIFNKKCRVFNKSQTVFNKKYDIFNESCCLLPCGSGTCYPFLKDIFTPIN